MHLCIIHGTMGNPEENWFPWLKSQAQNAGWTVSVPRFPTPENQSLTDWRDVFARSVGSLSQDMILVGHSLGSVFILRLLETAMSPVAASYLLSGFTGELGLPEFDVLNASFVHDPYQWEAIRRASRRCEVWMGDDDPYVPRSQGEDLAGRLGVPLRLVEHGGHLNAAAGFGSFAPLWDEIVDEYVEKT